MPPELALVCAQALKLKPRLSHRELSNKGNAEAELGVPRQIVGFCLHEALRESAEKSEEARPKRL